MISWRSKENGKRFYDIIKQNQVYPELYAKYNNTEKYLNKNKEEDKSINKKKKKNRVIIDGCKFEKRR
ncbi:MAG: hypothetical protein RR904_05560 [Bacilli bacterium]